MEDFQHHSTAHCIITGTYRRNLLVIYSYYSYSHILLVFIHFSLVSSYFSRFNEERIKYFNFVFEGYFYISQLFLLTISFNFWQTIHSHLERNNNQGHSVQVGHMMIKQRMKITLVHRKIRGGDSEYKYLKNPW